MFNFIYTTLKFIKLFCLCQQFKIIWSCLSAGFLQIKIYNCILIMIGRMAKGLLHCNRSHFSQSTFTPILYGSGKSIISISQWWNGFSPRPSDYYVEDKLQAELSGQWKLQDGIFRVVFSANLSDPSMNININLLKKSTSLNQLIQLSAAEKEQLVENPSTVVIRPIFSQGNSESENQIVKNMLELDKLFEDGVGLKTAYLVNAEALAQPEYLSEIKRRAKAVSADVALAGQSLANVLFDQGHRLQHVFYSSPFCKGVPPVDLQEVLSAMHAIDYKGKLVLSGENFDNEMVIFEAAAKKIGYSPKLQFSLQTDGWYTMT